MFRSAFVVAALFAASLASPSIASAQNVVERSSISIAPSLATSLSQPLRAAEEQVGAVQLPRPGIVINPGGSREGSSKAVLHSLYATTAALQLLDVDSTLKSLNRGAIETNPLMSGIVKNRAAFTVTKAGIAAATIYAAHKIGKDNKVAAVLTLVAINSAYAMIVKNNYAIANR
jgi:hypothetical protein